MALTKKPGPIAKKTPVVTPQKQLPAYCPSCNGVLDVKQRNQKACPYCGQTLL